MSREQIIVQKREILGKKVQGLRQQGILPANIYGPEVENVSVQLGKQEFEKLFKKVGETDLIDLIIKGEKDPRPVLIYEIQTDPVKDTPIHVDFFQVNLKEKVEVNVPIEFIGESLAVEEKRGELLTMLDELPVLALPTEIPSIIEVNISSLDEVGNQVMLADLKLPEGVEVAIEDQETLIAKIEAIKTAEEIEKELEEKEAEAAVEKEEEKVEKTEEQKGSVTEEKSTG